MIRHIVLFKLKPKVTRKEMEGLAKELNRLKQNIDEVRSVEVEMDVGRKDNSCDLILNALFDNMEDVKAYSVHPAHVKVLESINRLCESTTKIDYHTKWVGI